jgi:diaminopimelate decarboxylase
VNLAERFVPGHARDVDGTLTIGGARADELASRFGTPALILDLAVLDASIRTMLDACARHRIAVSYAAKALIVTALARRLSSYPIGIDVCSLGELVTAERGGIAAERMTLHGAGKTDEELEAVLDGRVGRTAIDNVEELERLSRLARGRVARLLLRLNTGIEAHTHELIRTAGDDSKFGLAPDDEPRTVELLRAAPNLELRGLHAHIGSQIYEPAALGANAQALVAAALRFREYGFGVERIVVGGGFGVQMHPEVPQERLDLDAAIGAIARAVPADLECEVEPGRALIAAAGTSLYRVVAVKRYERRTFAIVDGSMADNPRPAIYGAYHHAVPVRASDAPFHPVTLCGRTCENDVLGEVALPRDLTARDLVAMCTTGAYTYSMASNYNRFARPPIVAVLDGEPTLFAGRESLDDVLRSDL